MSDTSSASANLAQAEDMAVFITPRATITPAIIRYT